MRFVCDSCRAQYMISDDKVGAKGVKVRCKKCGYVILVRRADAAAPAAESAPRPPAPEGTPAEASSEAGAEGAAESGTEGSADSAPAAAASSDSPLGGILDDEIGAVFDQVLKSGPHKIEEKPSINSLEPPPEKESLDLGLDDDLASTRAVSTDALKKLVAEAEAVANATPRAPAPPPDDWYVAIDDQQQGPLAYEQVRDLWDRGELGPDSLCWRAGMGDWIPLSEVTELASALAPKPSKPVVVAPATSQVGTVVSVPVETSVNLGGVSRTVRTEQTFGAPAMAASDAPAADTGGWKPSAASALAALVSEEMTALSSPKPKPAGGSLLESGPGERSSLNGLDSVPAPKPAGLFDIPSAPGDIPGANGKGLFAQAPATDAAPSAALTQSPQQPYTGPSVYGATPYPSYTPPPAAGMSRGLKIGLGAGGAALLLLIGVVVVLLSRDGSPPAEATPPPPAMAAASPDPAPAASSAQPSALPMPPPPAGTVEKPAEATAQATPPAPSAPEKPEPVAAAPEKPAPVAARAEPVAARNDSSSASSSKPRRTGSTTSAAGRDDDDGAAIVARAPAVPPPTAGGGDDFDKLFGDDPKPAAKNTGSSKPKRQPGYIPPPPGGADVQESLGQSDIMQVVLANKSDIVKCVNEMKAKEPGISGKLVMRWTILTSGKTSSVSVRTAEFKDTYMARCMTGLVRNWKFPKHKVQGGPIDFPFTF